MIIAAVKLSDIELDVDAERANRAESKRYAPGWRAGGFLLGYMTAIAIVRRFTAEIIIGMVREFPCDSEESRGLRVIKTETLVCD